ncbi:hypothetical protein D3C73_797940 [compost metagenome]
MQAWHSASRLAAVLGRTLSSPCQKCAKLAVQSGEIIAFIVDISQLIDVFINADEAFLHKLLQFSCYCCNTPPRHRLQFLQGRKLHSLHLAEREQMNQQHRFTAGQIQLPVILQERVRNDGHPVLEAKRHAFAPGIPFFAVHAQPPLPAYGYRRYNVRGNGIVSRTWSNPQIQATVRSSPRPKPECGTEPYVRRSMYHL